MLSSLLFQTTYKNTSNIIFIHITENDYRNVYKLILIYVIISLIIVLYAHARCSDRLSQVLIEKHWILMGGHYLI